MMYKTSELRAPLHFRPQLHFSVQCLHQVLPVPSEVRLVVVAGDNDIGGEGAEGMLPHINQ